MLQGEVNCFPDGAGIPRRHYRFAAVLGYSDQIPPLKTQSLLVTVRAECCGALCHPASLWCWGNAAAHGSLPFCCKRLSWLSVLTHP